MLVYGAIPITLYHAAISTAAPTARRIFTPTEGWIIGTLTRIRLEAPLPCPISRAHVLSENLFATDLNHVVQIHITIYHKMGVCQGL